MNRQRVPMGRAVVAACALLGLGFVAAQADPYVILHGNPKPIVGKSIRVNRDGDVVLGTSRGPVTFQRRQVKLAVADKPADFDKAKQLVDAKNYDAAIPILEEIVKEYRGLEWDNQARGVLGEALMAKEQYRKAADAYEELLKDAGSDRRELKDWQRGYMRALLESKQFSKLNPLLDKIIASGDRGAAASAQVMRGDIRLAMNDLENALMDYLRSVLLFEEEHEVRPEALYKAALCMKKMRDNRAKELYKKLAEEYPESEYVNKAKKELGSM
ncbi:MAG: tetratricopeptide repeat protein [Kiritimatiellae bacterium]|nr:tetratricopeptide repeat protein [Kiritimatiellia bacterium]